MLLLLLACTGGAKPDGSSGDTDTGPAPTTPAVCEQYLQCLGDAGDGGLDAATEAYAAGGPCDDSEAETTRCEEECSTALHEAFLAHPSTPSCSDGSTLPSELVFPEGSHWRLEGETYQDKCGGDTMVSSVSVDVAGRNDERFTMNGTVKVDTGVSEDTYRDVDFACALDQYTFTCDKTTIYGSSQYQYYIRLTLSGALAPDLASATGLGDLEVEVSGVSCNSYTDWVGGPE